MVNGRGWRFVVVLPCEWVVPTVALLQMKICSGAVMHDGLSSCAVAEQGKLRFHVGGALAVAYGGASMGRGLWRLVLCGSWVSRNWVGRDRARGWCAVCKEEELLGYGFAWEGSGLIPRPWYPDLPASPTTDASTNIASQVIPTLFYPNFQNYMHGLHAQMPYAWLPPFVSRPDSNPTNLTSQENLVSPFHSSTTPQVGINFASSSHVEEIQDPTPDSGEVKTLSMPFVRDTVESKDNEASGIQNTTLTDGGNSIEEPKLGMVFRFEEELVSYYKKYGKQCGFRITRQMSKRDENENLRYVTLGCARGGKARNRTSNVARSRPT
ncbi:uncharacterized protein LOC121247278 [Juglans microcarpa x Juglans regia]|uniref:uncharacterized protein LOC121247278 n=1 Tax=Juglans microcarpa x Juglans regia TaxID=2249226 RepID=UPI001B7DBBD1|nr:uncharacterized protein LOC121247278 [Juglans microcarpa x Juglans regia]